jgi:hypothetical protein
MDLEGDRPAHDVDTAPSEMSLDQFLLFARSLRSATCFSCGEAEAESGGLCERCAAPSLTDRLGAVGRFWRRLAYRLGIA